MTWFGRLSAISQLASGGGGGGREWELGKILYLTQGKRQGGGQRSLPLWYNSNNNHQKFGSGYSISSESGSRVLRNRNWRKKYSRKFFYIFFGSKITIYLCLSYRSLQNRTSSTSKNEIV
jgi:hypothetical protein